MPDSEPAPELVHEDLTRQMMDALVDGPGPLPHPLSIDASLQHLLRVMSSELAVRRERRANGSVAGRLKELVSQVIRGRGTEPESDLLIKQAMIDAIVQLDLALRHQRAVTAELEHRLLALEQRSPHSDA